jgi:hypothetical protein
MLLHMNRTFSITLVLLASLIMVGCRASVGYKPPIVPIRLIVDSERNVSIVGDATLLTPVGSFSIGAEYVLKRDDNSLLVIIRDRKQGNNGFDTIYRLRSGPDHFVAVVNGRNTIQVVDRQVMIDVTEGNIESIEFRPALENISETSGISWQPWPLGYQPFALAKSAYNDSTIDKWYGIGFLWFLFRLVLAIIGLAVDMFLIVFLGIGVILHTFFGITVRNIYFGLLALYLLALLFLGLGSK